jgi:glycyl-tRNA synthetase beta subunit
VMDENLDLRYNKLALLQHVRGLFEKIADFNTF